MTKKDNSRLNGPKKTKGHPIWCDEYKPWAFPDWPFSAAHTTIELHYLYRTAFRLGKGNYANLGVYQGASVHALARGAAAHEGHVFGVDTFEISDEYPGMLEKEKLEAEFVNRALQRYTTLHKGLTSEWAKKLDHLRFKFIFIDADHSYESCLEDFMLWSPLLEPEGLVSFHDCDMDTIHEVLTTALDRWELVDHVYSIKTFKRRST